MEVYVGNRLMGNPMDLPTVALPAFDPNNPEGGGDGFTQTEAVILEMSSRVASMVSIACSLAVIATFCFWKRFRTPANRLLAFMACADLMSATSTLLGKLAMSLPDYSPVCVLQAFLMQWGDLSSAFWTAAMAFNLFMVLFMTRSARDLASLEKFYFFICFGVPFMVAFAPIFIWEESRGLAYGHDVLWCWLSGRWDGLRLALFYIPIWTIFLFNLGIYASSSITILIRTSNLPPPRDKNRLSSVSSDSSTFAAHHENMDTPANTLASNTPTTQRPPAFSSASTVSATSQVSFNTLQTFRSRYFVRIGLFLLAYVLAWFVPSVNRIRGWVVGHEEEYQRQYFMWYWTQEILTPLRGCINFFCYYILALANVFDEIRKTRK